MAASKRKQLAELLESQFGKCFYCRYPIRLADNNQLESLEYDPATYDHLKPLARGGKQNGTGVAACHICNVHRGKRLFFEYYLCSRKPGYTRKIHSLRNKAIFRCIRRGQFLVKYKDYQFIDLTQSSVETRRATGSVA